MILRSTRYDILFIFSYLLLESTFSFAADTPFDCHLTVDNNKFDLTSLVGVHVVNRTREVPPSVMVDSLRFDLCEELKPQEGIPENDQCPSGTRACLTKVNQKANEPDRVVAVIPLAQTTNLNPTYSASLTPKYLSLQLHGAEYPLSTNSTLIRQSLNLTLICDPETESSPEFVAYDGSRLDLKWSAPAGCPFKDEDGGGNKDKDKDKGGNEEKENVGSGVGWFFLVVFLAFAAYLGLGAYYNYTTYGATGFDLIPHRDFWKEVPYMLSDVVSHLCSNVRPRRTSSRGGYISV